MGVVEELEGRDIFQAATEGIAPLGEALDAGSPWWTVGLEGVVHAKQRTLLYGSDGEGKTWAELSLAVQCALAGGRVLVLDYEMGRGPIEARCEELLGVTAEGDGGNGWAVIEDDRIEVVHGLDLQALRRGNEQRRGRGGSRSCEGSISS